VSFTLGRPVAIRDDEIDVPMPSHLDDEAFGADRPIVVNSLPSDTSPFLHLIRIRRISGQILGCFYNARYSNHIPIEEKRRIRRQFHEKVNAWYRDTSILLHRVSAEEGYVSSFLTQEWYDAVYNNALLLLYRPSPFLSYPDMATGPEDPEPALINLLMASRTAILSYSTLHQRRRLNYSWITLHGVFIAGLAYVYSVGKLLREPEQKGRAPDVIGIVEVTRACSNVLVAISERWNKPRRSCELFNKLSNAVIRDAVNMASRHDTGPPSGIGGGSEPGQVRAPHHPDSANDRQYDPAMQLGVPSIPNNLSSIDEFLVMDEFGRFSACIDTYMHGTGSFPSEVISGFSQSWPFDETFQLQL
jgi:hypothetical protein